jgi:hypothetical protein
MKTDYGQGVRLDAWRNSSCINVVLSVLISWAALAQSPVQYEKWISTFGGRTAGLLTLDSQGQIYIAGTDIDSVPTTANAFAPVPASTYYEQGYLLKLDPTGATVLYGTYLNGLAPKRIAVDPAGYIYILV